MALIRFIRDKGFVKTGNTTVVSEEAAAKLIRDGYAVMHEKESASVTVTEETIVPEADDSDESGFLRIKKNKPRHKFIGD